MSGRGILAQEGRGVLSGPSRHPEPKTSAAQLFPHSRPALFYRTQISCAPVFFPETRTSIPSSTLPAAQASRPPARRWFPSFQMPPPAPRYLILGCPRCSGSTRSSRGSSGPPLSQAGAGGAAPPRGAVGFSNTNTAPLSPRPAPPPSHGPAPPCAEVPRALRPAFWWSPLASAQVPNKMANAGCRVQGGRYRVWH